MITFTRHACGLRNVLAVLCLLLSTASLAQEFKNSVYQDSKTIEFTAASLTTPPAGVALNLPPAVPLDHRAEAATLEVKFDAGDVYKVGNIVFKADVTYTLSAGNPDGTLGATLCNNCQLTITNQKPATLYTGGFDPAGRSTLRLEVSRVTVDVTDTRYVPAPNTNPPSPTPDQVLESNIANSLRLTGSYRIPYGIDWQSTGTAPATVQISDLKATPLETKQYRFSWRALFKQQATIYAAGYQLQLLRIYNQQDFSDGVTLDWKGAPLDDALRVKLKNEMAAAATLDWSKALTMNVEDGRTAVDLTVAEGTGFYAWRVRPLGSFAPNGAANARNAGPWSGADVRTMTVFERNATNPALVSDLPGIAYFYYKDTDERINSIYSRTFTEGNRASEKITYASVLQQAKQTQAHLPSKKTTVVSQTVYDHNNRPALSTLPVPQENKNGLTGYQEGFVKPAGSSEPYGAQHFDQEGRIRPPMPIDQGEKSDFKYYSGKRDDNVPNAEGYPFTRSLFYNDGTNRVREQSGVGKAHALGEQNQGMGRTVRTNYGTASETELIRLFGDEAPRASSVIKTITEDQNNTATVTYTSKEGKVLATCLSYLDQSLADGLEAVGTADPVSITDVLDDNVPAGAGLVASKRLALLDETSLAIDYKVTPCADPTDLGCYTANQNCTYDLWVYVKKVDGAPFAADLVRGAWQIAGGAAANAPYDVLYQKLGGLSCGDAQVKTFETLKLAMGTYVVEKYVVPTAAEKTVEVARAKIAAQIEPLANFIKQELAKVTCDQEVKRFYQTLKNLQDRLVAANGNATELARIDQEFLGLPVGQVFFTKAHRVTLQPDYNSTTGETPKTVSLSSSCCTGLKIPIAYVPVFDFSNVRMQEATSTIDGMRVNPFLHVDKHGRPLTEFFPDFEGYAYNFFWNCVPTGQTFVDAINAINAAHGSSDSFFANNFIYAGNADIYNALYPDPEEGTIPDGPVLTPAEKETAVKDKIRYIYYKIMVPNLTGWDRPGTFNLMVQHMLTDKYNCDGTGVIPIKEPGVNPDNCGKPGAPCSSGDCPLYKGDDLFRCWVAQLSYVQNTLTTCPQYAEMPPADGPPYKVSQSVDQEKEGDEGFHDNQFDSNMKGGWITKLFLKRKIKKISKRIRGMQDPQNFEEGGDGGGKLEASELINARHNYHMVKEFLNCTGYRFQAIINEAALDQPPAYYDGKDRTTYKGSEQWKVVMAGEDLFMHIKDPVYAFKYFHYVKDSNPFVELATCYSDPNKDANGNYICANADNVIDDKDLCNFCGIGKVKCDVTKDQWSCGQRYTFYQMLSKYREQTAPVNYSDGQMKPTDYASPGYIDVNSSNQQVFIPWEAGKNTEYTTSTYGGVTASFSGTDRLRTKVEIDISELNQGLAGICGGKRSAFAQQLQTYLQDRCYQIGGCKVNANDNIIPLEDFDLLVDLMVEECKKRGEINTYRTNETKCLDYTKRGLAGYPAAAHHQTVTLVEYGVFEPGDAAGVCSVGYVKYRPAGTTGFNPDAVNVSGDIKLAATGTTGTTLEIMRCTGEGTSFSQWLKRREVSEMNMNLVINLPSMCNPDPKNPYPARLDVTCDETQRPFPADPNVHNFTVASPEDATQPAYKSPAKRLQVDVDNQNKVKVNGELKN